MTFELILLVWSVILLFVHIGVQSTLMTKDMGSDYNSGPRDEELKLGKTAGRAQRALNNYLETYPAFIALALIVAVADQSGWLTQWGAGFYMLGRIAYLPLYVMGVRYIRSLAFVTALAGMVMMVIGVMI